MRVSFLELYVHCKKAFEACGIPYGCAEDGAEAAAWGEFSGLSGLQVLVGELDRISAHKMEDIQLLAEREKVAFFEGGGQSGLLAGKAAADYAYAQSEKQETAIAYVRNSSASRLLARQAFDIASNGKGCAIHFKTEEGTPVWIAAVPDNPYPVLAEGYELNSVFGDELVKKMETGENLEVADQFLLVCTKDINIIDQLIVELKSKVKEEGAALIDSAQIKNSLESSKQCGAKIDRMLWDTLNQTGQKVLVESSELSRLRGAGELA